MGTAGRFGMLWVGALGLLGVVGLPDGIRPARAEITSVTVEYTAPFPQYNGKSYTYVEATVSGTVTREDESEGSYSVGLVLIYPGSGSNGVGLVEWANTVYFPFYGGGAAGVCPRGMPFCAPEDADQGERLQNLAIQYSRLALEDYPWREGYTYAAIGWDKIVTDLFGNEPEDSRHNRLVFGSIELITDAHYILGDIARWLRSPTGFSGGTAPASVDHVISLGFSQTALLQNSFLQGGFNEEEGGGLVYDGFLLQSGGVFCWQFGALPNVCHGEFPFIASPGEAKRIVIATESDVQAIMGASLNRGPVENHVQYEIAGLAHNSGKLLDTTFLGATQQNPQDPSPFARGALRNLTRWIVDGTAPPPALHLEGDPNTFDPNSGGMTVDRDADGNVLGGVRPPWMPSMVEDMPAGAPLGVYGGLDVSGFDPFNVFLLLSGTFQPFSDSEIESRYPTPEAYKELVTRAADHLLAEEYILEEDRDAYVANAILELPELPPLGTPDAGPGETDPPDGGCGCRLGDDGSSGAGMGWLVLLFGTLLGVRRGWRR